MRYLVLPVVLLIFLSCDQDEVLNEIVTPVAVANMEDCHATKSWDPAKVRNSLSGKWRWIYAVCAGQTDFTRFVEIEIVFSGVNQLLIYENQKLFYSTAWNLEASNLKYSLITDLQSDLLDGELLFCNSNQLTFKGGECDQMFYRVR